MILNSIMTVYPDVLTLNILPPEKLFCDFNYWSSIFSQDIQTLKNNVHGVPLSKLSPEASEMIFPYLLLALAEYKILNKKRFKGIGLDHLISLWLDKYYLNKNGYFELVSSSTNIKTNCK